MIKRLFFIFLFPLISSAQDSVRSVEFGLRLCSYRPTIYFEDFQPMTNDLGPRFPDGIFVRFNKKEISYRLTANYFSTSNFTGAIRYSVPIKGINFSKMTTYELNAGIQWNFCKNRLYLLAEGFYANRNKVAAFTNRNGEVIAEDNMTLQELGIAAGLGFKKNLGKYFALGLEYKSNMFFQLVNEKLRGPLLNNNSVTRNTLKMRATSQFQLMMTYKIY